MEHTLLLVFRQFHFASFWNYLHPSTPTTWLWDPSQSRCHGSFTILGLDEENCSPIFPGMNQRRVFLVFLWREKQSFGTTGVQLKVEICLFIYLIPKAQIMSLLEQSGKIRWWIKAGSAHVTFFFHQQTLDSPKTKQQILTLSSDHHI